jgi:hypothetical protein
MDPAHHRQATPTVPENTVKIIACDRFKPGVTLETITPWLPQEVAHVWRLWKAGIEWFFIPVVVPLPIEALFRDDVDIAEPYDRTLAG